MSAGPAGCNQPPPLAEISVAEASAEIRSIYQDIARLSGIPLPALIWRHLATYPSVLPEIWQSLRPLYVSGEVQDAAWGAVERVLGGETSELSPARLKAAGLGTDVIDGYRRVIMSYNRANPMNFVGVRLVLATLAKPIGLQAAPREIGVLRFWTPPWPIERLPPMVPVSDITGDVRHKINDLAAATGIDRGQVVPSLYRHLVPWPALIDLVHAEVAPRVQSGEVMALTSRIAEALQIEAEALAFRMPPISDLVRTKEVTSALEAFSLLIPEMVVIGRLLMSGLGREA